MLRRIIDEAQDLVSIMIKEKKHKKEWRDPSLIYLRENSKRKVSIRRKTIEDANPLQTDKTMQSYDQNTEELLKETLNKSI